MRGALKDALNVETVNDSVGRVNPAAPAGNYSQLSATWERAQVARVVICGRPIELWRFIFTLGRFANFTTQLRQLLLLNGLAACNLRPCVGSGIITTLVLFRRVCKLRRRHSYCSVKVKQRGINVCRDDCNNIFNEARA